MVDRRTFTALLAGTIVAPRASFGQSSMTTRNVFYASAGPELTLYSVDVDGAALVRRGTVSTAANIQYAWPHPSKQYLYVVSSDGGPGSSGAVGTAQGTGGAKHIANVFKIDSASGALTQHGETVIDPGAVCMDEKTLLGSYSSSFEILDEVTDLIFGGYRNGFDLTQLISHRFPLDRSVQAIEIASQPKADSMKIMIEPELGAGAN